MLRRWFGRLYCAFFPHHWEAWGIRQEEAEGDFTTLWICRHCKEKWETPSRG